VAIIPDIACSAAPPIGSFKSACQAFAHRQVVNQVDKQAEACRRYHQQGKQREVIGSGRFGPADACCKLPRWTACGLYIHRLPIYVTGTSSPKL
jgi:hypothetical protein